MAPPTKKPPRDPKTPLSRSRKGGRPPKPDAERCSKRIMLYLTETEYTRLQALKKAPGQSRKSLNQSLKERLLEPAQSPATEASVVLLSLLLSIDANRVQLKRIGVNLNQLIHRVNSELFPSQLKLTLQKLLDLYPDLQTLIETEKAVFNTLEKRLDNSPPSA